MRIFLSSLYIFTLCIYPVRTQDKVGSCYPPKGVIKRNFYVEEHDLPFRIEVSQRISHQLVSHIAQILLQDVIGYQQVSLVEKDTDNTTRTLEKISNCTNPWKCQKISEKGPELMVNLELWIPPGFNLEQWIATKRIEDCGPLGPIGRSGWFVEHRIVEFFWKENYTVIDHYKAFLNTEITRYFDLTSDEMVIQKATESCFNLTKPDDLDCGTDGFYRPPQCRNSQNNCATILSDYPESTFGILRDAILRHKLYVNIAWLGNEFEDTLRKLIITPPSHEKKNILFYHRKPMMLSSVLSIDHVTFPGCEDDSVECDFEVNQLQKVVWSEIKSSATHAFQVIRALHFSQEQYHKLLFAYYHGLSRNRNFSTVACDWVKENEVIWLNWIPEDVKEKTTLYIGGIFPMTGVYWKQNSVIEAADLAAQAINNSTSLLPNYTLKILQQDGHCTTDEVMKSFIHYIKSDYYKTMVGILGPACSDTVEPIAGVAKHFSTIIISYSAEGTLLNSQEKYPFFFRTIPENNMFRYVYLKLFRKLGYTRVAALTEDGQKYPEYLSYLQDLMDKNKMKFIVNRKFPRERTFTDMSTYLEDLKNRGARIIIGDFYDYAARSVMCTAYKLHMTAENGYVWFLPSWYPLNWYDTDELNNKQNSTEWVPCTTAEMINAINGHMSLAYKFYGDPESIMQENKTIKAWRKSYDLKTRHKKKIPSCYGGYTYDAVWVYALALDILFKENESHIATLHSSRTSRRLMELMRQTNFKGVTGELYFQNGSRISDVMIGQWLNRSRRMIGIYRASSPSDGDLELNETNIKWLTPNGLKPEDGSKELEDCEMEGLRAFLGIKCRDAKIVTNVIGIAGFFFLIVILIIFFKRRYEKRMEDTEKRMKELGLLGIKGVPFALDEWEMPRDHIVINRKLGEGAFGTVYGGEALVRNKGWIAVAVKTLKRGAKPEEKLDFLSEAEVMKQFDHVNIVKLVGVCTTGEPVYTVMEFMLYGDLKTYLLGRRNMASEKDRQKNDEISDRRLTNMALDIARGLSYLAERKFVHRDLACRNCLVNTSRSVKIADFGMCRAMYDSDYYRYNKKGMLPIRWMAPESLIDGLFTPMSDIWSYGVVLYEIITFASFPYQGFSHEQVLAHVKSHKTLPVPKGCKPELEDLLHKCWSSIPQNRPQGKEIVEILALNPELITPCLDVPAASVALEDSGALEVPTPDRARGHSFSSVWQSRKSGASQELGALNTSEFLQSAHNTAHGGRHTAFKLSNKKSIHESFKKAKRDHQKDRTVDYQPQVTYL